ncbi:MAG: glutamate-5-semialdehyde dehydrogenase [Dysgonamonadaceae bacterium]|jgi:glutamate-5-semialdehyde dehydrogenase|nr:glutamate-5-semialdehyde dehydrogenase [Dysgonamonadaceae bacterium]
MKDLFEKIQNAGKTLNLIDDEKVNQVLLSIADRITSGIDLILSENKKDLDRMEPENPKYDRLKLTPERIAGIAEDMRHVARLPSPLGQVLMQEILPNGMELKKIPAPFGVIGIIYEARPNVTPDVFSLCLKSGNVCVLKGGSDAEYSNRAIVNIIREVLSAEKINPDTCTLLSSDREATVELLNATGYVDLIIPRGSRSLIQYVRDHSKIPVIETGAGICHTYFDKSGDKEKGRAIVTNAKTRRVSVCNALDCLIIHQERLQDLPYLCGKLMEKKVIIYADVSSYNVLNSSYPSDLLQPAYDGCYGTEFLDYKMSISTVQSIEEALAHISKYGSKHSECIVSESKDSVDLFQKRVDAACVYANVSTAFTDGAQFGMGAEIGISTQKMHARGPMALKELTTYKWLISGDGQVRTN